MFCSKCGANNADGAKFCAQCGNALASASAPAAGTFGSFSGGAKTETTKRINPRDYFKAATNLDGTTIAPPKPIVPDIPVEMPEAEVKKTVDVVQPLEESGVVAPVVEENVVKEEIVVEENLSPVKEHVVESIKTDDAQMQVPVNESVSVPVNENVSVQVPVNETAQVKTPENGNLQQTVEKAIEEKPANIETIAAGEAISVVIPDAADVKAKKKKQKKEKKEKTKGGKKGWMIAGIIVLVIALLVTTVFFAWEFLLFHFAPKFYTEIALSNTMNELSKELDDFAVNFTGVDPNGEEVTMKVSASVTGLIGSGDVKDASVDFGASRSAKDEEFKFSADASLNGVAYELFDVIWDNSVIAVKSTGIIGDENVYTVPSKNFGEKFNESAHADRFNIPESLDLEASKFMPGGTKQDKGEVEELIKIVNDFVESTELTGKDTVKIVIDGKERSVYKLDYEAEDKDFAAFVKAYLNFAKESDTMRFMYEAFVEDYGSEEAMEEAIDEMEFDDVNISFYIYKGMIVRIDIPLDDDFNRFFQFTKTDDLLNNFEMGSVYEYENSDGEDAEDSFIIRSEGNLTTGADEVENVYTITEEVDGDVVEEIVVTVNFNFKDGEFSAKIENALDENEDAPVTVISGTCERGKDGFKLALGDVTRVQGDVTYSMLSVLADEVKLEIELMPKAKVEIENLDENRKDVLDMTEEELNELVNNVQNNLNEIFNF